MSGHGQADTSHDDHHEPETSSDDFPADEPRSPGWLPLLGGALFVAGIAAFIVFGVDNSGAAPAAADGAALVPAAAAQPVPAQRPAVAQPEATERPTNRLPARVQLPAGHPQ